MTKQEAKEQIQKLVEKYEIALKSNKVSSYTEEETKKDFILPLFEAIGWDTQNREEVSAEEHIKSSGRVDYGFSLNGRTKFYLEAKPLRADLHKVEYAQQSIRYAFNRVVTWAVLTDFERIKVFNAQATSKYLGDKLYFDISYDQFIERFDQLWLLSKEAFQTDLIDKEAEKSGKKLQKISITDALYKDLNESREILTKALSAWNQEVSPMLLDEGVQKLLDRLIFLRVAEDRGIEPSILKQLIRDWDSRKDNKLPLYQSMIEKFRELDEIYNSNLFSKHPFEGWQEDGSATEKVIDKLYGKEGYYEYDFKIMPADVLGTVYENYLGHQLAQSKKEGISINTDAKKRKEQGIYYTPIYIVDYIVTNALKPVLDKCKSVADLKKIKVLDPACGSGSFLIKALDVINDKYKDFGYRGDEMTKLQILTENIYGVDLDEKAVEIARLNLLVNSLDKRMKMPGLEKNIKNGNSLISGTDEELKKYFGKNYRDKKPFNWEEEFPDVFKQGGFDVIIGNPPYVRNRELDIHDKEFFNNQYQTASGQYDLYQLFFERSLKLLKPNGLLGFITSNKYAIADYGKKLREYILEYTKISSILDVSNLQVFKEASTYPYVIILEKASNNSNHLIKGLRVESDNDLTGSNTTINQDDLRKSPTKNFVIKDEIPFFSKIDEKSERLGDIATIKETIHTGNVRAKLIVDQKVDETCKKLLAGKDCHRYWFKWGGKWLRYDKNLIDKSSGEYANLVSGEYFEKPKIFLREIALNLECSYDDEKYYSLNKVYSVQSRGKYEILYLLGLLNSKLLSFYFRHKFEEAHVQNGYLQFKKIYTSQIPIYQIDFSNKMSRAKHDEIAKLAEKITVLHKNLVNEEENSNKWESLKSEIEKTDRQIDQLVYKLYGLTDKEIKIIENYDRN